MTPPLRDVILSDQENLVAGVKPAKPMRVQNGTRLSDDFTSGPPLGSTLEWKGRQTGMGGTSPSVVPKSGLCYVFGT